MSLMGCGYRVILTDDYYGHRDVSIKQGQYLNIEHKNGFIESYPIRQVEHDEVVWGEYRVKKEELFRHAGLYGRIWTSEEREQKIEREQDGGFEIE